jgi:micrococcal nuclease
MILLLTAAVLMSTFPSVEVKRIHDGDTFFVSLPNEPTIFGQDLPVRIKGINTGELTAKGCERVDGLAAKEALEIFLISPMVELSECTRDKYFRIDCRVTNEWGEDVAKILKKMKLAQPYDGGTKQPWKCRKD